MLTCSTTGVTVPAWGRHPRPPYLLFQSQLQPLGHVMEPRAVSRALWFAIRSAYCCVVGSSDAWKFHSDAADADARGHASDANDCENSSSYDGSYLHAKVSPCSGRVSREGRRHTTGCVDDHTTRPQPVRHGAGGLLRPRVSTATTTHTRHAPHAEVTAARGMEWLWDDDIVMIAAKCEGQTRRSQPATSKHVPDGPRTVLGAVRRGAVHVRPHRRLCKSAQQTAQQTVLTHYGKGIRSHCRVFATDDNVPPPFSLAISLGETPVEMSYQ